ncbi:MAG: hypothetical protein E6Q98_24645 [Rhodospirillaceae bacterium]|nr:MAG: hypothetical protein E6Q98_24645 [Rhodospirillaceae bacterium]
MAKKTSSQPPAAGKVPGQDPATLTEPATGQPAIDQSDSGQSDSGSQSTDGGQPAAERVQPIVPMPTPSAATVARVAAQLGERPCRQLADFIKDVADRLGIDPDTVFAIGKKDPVVVTVDGRKLEVPHED